MIPLLLVLIAAISYFIGTVSMARILARYALKKPIRKAGFVSYSAFERMFGRKWAFAIGAADAAKTAVAVLIGGLLMLIPGSGFPIIGRLFAGMCVVIGDIHPYQSKLRGGHGVVPLMTALWLSDWRIGLVALAVLVIVVAISQYMSLACLTGSFVGALSAWVFVEQEQMKGLAGLIVFVAFLFILWRYRANVIRLITKQRPEPKVNWGKRPESRLNDDF